SATAYRMRIMSKLLFDPEQITLHKVRLHKARGSISPASRSDAFRIACAQKTVNGDGRPKNAQTCDLSLKFSSCRKST
ncbi:MAG: hypothetical protein P8Y71_25980, partial [Pseudolabrys sp.]